MFEKRASLKVLLSQSDPAQQFGKPRFAAKSVEMWIRIEVKREKQPIRFPAQLGIDTSNIRLILEIAPFKFYRFLKLRERLRQSSVCFIRSSQKIVCKPIARIEFDGSAKFFYRPFVVVRKKQCCSMSDVGVVCAGPGFVQKTSLRCRSLATLVVTSGDSGSSSPRLGSRN